MNYFEINREKIFRPILLFDDEKNLIVYKNFVVGRIVRTDTNIQYMIKLPSLKNKNFIDTKLNTKSFFTDIVHFDSGHRIYLESNDNYIQIGYDGNEVISITLPLLCSINS